MTEEVKVFRSWTSPFPLRVILALKLKGIDFEIVTEDLKNKSDLLLQYNPVHKKVPVLVHNGKPICESLVILEYIDETWKETPLLPQDPLERASARFWAKFGDEKVMISVFRAALTHGKEKEEANIEKNENLKYVEELLKGKRFFGGERIGFLDLAFSWMANLLNVMEEITGEKYIREEDFPLLSKWIQDLSSTPLIKESSPPREYLVPKYEIMHNEALAANTYTTK